MKTILKKTTVVLSLSTLFVLGLFACKDLSQLNVNPNGVQPETVNPNLVLPTVLSETAKLYTNLGFQDIAGVVPRTQKDAWCSGHHDYDWGGDQSWTALDVHEGGRTSDRKIRLLPC